MCCCKGSVITATIRSEHDCIQSGINLFMWCLSSSLLLLYSHSTPTSDRFVGCSYCLRTCANRWNTGKLQGSLLKKDKQAEHTAGPEPTSPCNRFADCRSRNCLGVGLLCASVILLEWIPCLRKHEAFVGSLPAECGKHPNEMLLSHLGNTKNQNKTHL